MRHSFIRIGVIVLSICLNMVQANAGWDIPQNMFGFRIDDLDETDVFAGRTDYTAENRQGMENYWRNQKEDTVLYEGRWIFRDASYDRTELVHFALVDNQTMIEITGCGDVLCLVIVREDGCSENTILPYRKPLVEEGEIYSGYGWYVPEIQELHFIDISRNDSGDRSKPPQKGSKLYIHGANISYYRECGTFSHGEISPVFTSGWDYVGPPVCAAK